MCPFSGTVGSSLPFIPYIDYFHSILIENIGKQYEYELFIVIHIVFVVYYFRGDSMENLKLNICIHIYIYNDISFKYTFNLHLFPKLNLSLLTTL